MSCGVPGATCFVTCWQITDLRGVDVATFVAPFLEVIRSESVAGPVTAIALSSINKFLTYGTIGAG